MFYFNDIVGSIRLNHPTASLAVAKNRKTARLDRPDVFAGIGFAGICVFRRALKRVGDFKRSSAEIRKFRIQFMHRSFKSKGNLFCFCWDTNYNNHNKCIQKSFHGFPPNHKRIFSQSIVYFDALSNSAQHSCICHHASLSLFRCADDEYGSAISIKNSRLWIWVPWSGSSIKIRDVPLVNQFSTKLGKHSKRIMNKGRPRPQAWARQRSR